MTPWIITLSNNTLVRSVEVTVGQQAAVALLLDTQDHIALDPTRSFQALATWVAVLEAAANETEVMDELTKVMEMTVHVLYSKITME